MKTLIINGSPRKNGDTAALLDTFTNHLEGEVKIVSHEDRISPCYDCRFCKSYDGCPINDAMQDVYEYLEDCDNVVLASPIWFASLSGPALTIASRLQTRFCARYFRGEETEPNKNGILILVGGQAGSEKAAEASARMILRNMDVLPENTMKVYSLDTDRLPAAEDETALSAAKEAALRLNMLWNAKQNG